MRKELKEGRTWLLVKTDSDWRLVINFRWLELVLFCCSYAQTKKWLIESWRTIIITIRNSKQRMNVFFTLNACKMQIYSSQNTQLFTAIVINISSRLAVSGLVDVCWNADGFCCAPNGTTNIENTGLVPVHFVRYLLVEESERKKCANNSAKNGSNWQRKWTLYPFLVYSHDSAFQFSSGIIQLIMQWIVAMHSILLRRPFVPLFQMSNNNRKAKRVISHS